METNHVLYISAERLAIVTAVIFILVLAGFVIFLASRVTGNNVQAVNSAPTPPGLSSFTNTGYLNTGSVLGTTTQPTDPTVPTLPQQIPSPQTEGGQPLPTPTPVPPNPTNTPVPTSPPAPTSTPTPSPQPSASPTPSPSITPSIIPSPTASVSATVTPTPTPQK